jgi:hypothetical protein
VRVTQEVLLFPYWPSGLRYPQVVTFAPCCSVPGVADRGIELRDIPNLASNRATYRRSDTWQNAFAQ